MPSEERTLLPIVDVPLSKDGFMRELIHHLSAVLENVVGIEEAAGFVSVVGQRMGDRIHSMYLDELDREGLSPDQISAVLVDLKDRIDGEFYVIEETDDHIVFGNRRCPFGEWVLDRPTMCMMTSNVFGSIAAKTHGYAKVELQETIASGGEGCRVVVYLAQTQANAESPGREYFRE